MKKPIRERRAAKRRARPGQGGAEQADPAPPAARDARVGGARAGRGRRVAGWAATATAILLATAYAGRVRRDLHAAGAGPPVTQLDGAPVGALAQPPAAESSAPPVEWPALGQLDLATGAVPPALTALTGRVVRVPGFIIPFDDMVTSTREFLLVPYPGACIHVPAPPANQMVYVTMAGAPTPTYWMQPVWVEGVLAAERRESVYGAAGFAMRGLRVLRYDPPNGAADDA